MNNFFFFTVWECPVQDFVWVWIFVGGWGESYPHLVGGVQDLVEVSVGREDGEGVFVVLDGKDLRRKKKDDQKKKKRWTLVLRRNFNSKNKV